MREWEIIFIYDVAWASYYMLLYVSLLSYIHLYIFYVLSFLSKNKHKRLLLLNYSQGFHEKNIRNISGCSFNLHVIFFFFWMYKHTIPAATLNSFLSPSLPILFFSFPFSLSPEELLKLKRNYFFFLCKRKDIKFIRI